jgi:hypothetical protein
MKKLIIAATIAAGTLGTGAVFAQADHTGTQPGYVNPQYGPQVYGNSGWTPDRAYGGNVYVVPNIIGQAQILSDGRFVVPGALYGYSQYERTNRDRDGDGIRNNRDRYPDDPRYR